MHGSSVLKNAPVWYERQVRALNRPLALSKKDCSLLRLSIDRGTEKKRRRPAAESFFLTLSRSQVGGVPCFRIHDLCLRYRMLNRRIQTTSSTAMACGGGGSPSRAEQRAGQKTHSSRGKRVDKKKGLELKHPGPLLIDRGVVSFWCNLRRGTRVHWQQEGDGSHGPFFSFSASSSRRITHAPQRRTQPGRRRRGFRVRCCLLRASNGCGDLCPMSVSRGRKARARRRQQQ